MRWSKKAQRDDGTRMFVAKGENNIVAEAMYVNGKNVWSVGNDEWTFCTGRADSLRAAIKQADKTAKLYGG